MTNTDSIYLEIDGEITSLEIDTNTIQMLIDLRRRNINYVLELTEHGEVKAKCPIQYIHFKQ